MAQIQNSHSARGPWFEGNFYNMVDHFGRRFEDVGSNGPPHKRRRDAYFRNSYSVLPFVRRTEDESLCMPSLKEDCNNNSNRFRAGEEGTSCSEGSDADCYYTREAIERLSPSRRDGIDLQKETFLRCSYVAFLQTLGARLQLPQTTIATAIVLCHRFFFRRSHASHDRFLIGTAAIFLAAKSEETPRPLNNVLVMSYQIYHEQDLASFNYRLPKDWFEQYKQRVLEAEHMLLTALDFELTVQHPYGPLMSVLSKIGLAHTTLLNLAWNFINEGSCTPNFNAIEFTITSQYGWKDEYIRGNMFCSKEDITMWTLVHHDVDFSMRFDSLEKLREDIRCYFTLVITKPKPKILSSFAGYSVCEAQSDTGKSIRIDATQDLEQSRRSSLGEREGHAIICSTIFRGSQPVKTGYLDGRALWLGLNVSKIEVSEMLDNDTDLTSRLRGSLSLQFKPHHIAAGAVSLAANVLNFDLSKAPSLWQEFQTTSSIIQDVVKQLTELS